MLGGHVDRLLEPAEPDQEPDQHLRGDRPRRGRRGRARGAWPGSGRWPLDVPAEQGPEVDGVVAVMVLERRVALVSVAVGEAPAVVGQADGQRDRRGVDQQGREPDGRRQVRDVEVIGVVDEQPVAALDQAGDRRPLGRERLAPPGDLGPEVGVEVVVEPADQPVGAGDAGRLVGRAGASKAEIAEQVP